MADDYRDDSLRLDSNIQPTEVRDFVEGRLKDPIALDGGQTMVWTFTNHEIDREALRNEKERLDEDYYVIPYQVPSGWSYMQRLLPMNVRNSPYIVWSNKQHRYRVTPNLRNGADAAKDTKFRRDMEQWLNGQWFR